LKTTIQYRPRLVAITLNASAYFGISLKYGNTESMDRQLTCGRKAGEAGTHDCHIGFHN
jgi:hypothetical protein